MPAAMDPRGRSGPSMLQLHEWIAEHAAMNRNTASADDAAELGIGLGAAVSAARGSGARRPRQLGLCGSVRQSLPDLPFPNLGAWRYLRRFLQADKRVSRSLEQL